MADLRFLWRDMRGLEETLIPWFLVGEPADERYRCTRRKRNGARCRKARVKGMTVCASHGGDVFELQVISLAQRLEAQLEVYLRERGYGK